MSRVHGPVCPRVVVETVAPPGILGVPVSRSPDLFLHWKPGTVGVLPTVGVMGVKCTTETVGTFGPWGSHGRESDRRIPVVPSIVQLLRRDQTTGVSRCEVKRRDPKSSPIRPVHRPGTTHNSLSGRGVRPMSPSSDEERVTSKTRRGSGLEYVFRVRLLTPSPGRHLPLGNLRDVCI